MPARVVKSSSSGSKKKKGGGGFFGKLKDIVTYAPGSKIGSQTVKDLGNIAATAPAGVIDLTTDFGRATKETLTMKDPKALSKFGKQQGKTQYEGVKAVVQHPLRNPGYTLVQALGLAPTPFAAASKVGTVAAKVSGKPRVHKKPPTRTLRYKPKESERDFYKEALKLKNRPKTIGVEVNAARLPTTRAVQKGVDRVRAKVPALQRNKVEKSIARNMELLSRRDADNSPDLTNALKQLKTGQPFKQLNPVKNPFELLKEGNAAVRGLRLLLKPAYIPPNRLGAEAANLIQMGPRGTLKAGRTMHQIRKTDKDSAQTISRMMGETSDQGKLMESGAGPIATFMTGLGNTMGKVTDRAPRGRSFVREAKRQGYDLNDPSALNRLLNERSPKTDRDLVLAADRAERDAIKFTRQGAFPGRELGAASKIDRKLADNLFLYKWLTGSSQYSGRMLTEHPTISAALANQGQDAPSLEEVAEEMGAKVPEFMKHYVPAGMRGKLPLARNPLAASLFDMPGETVSRIKEGLRDPRELAAFLNPMQATAMNAATGFDPFRDQDILSRNNPEAGLLERLKFGAATQLRGLPQMELLRLNDSAEEKEGRLFPHEPQDILGRFLAGGTFKSFPWNPETATAMATQQDSKNDRKKRRRKTSSKF